MYRLKLREKLAEFFKIWVIRMLFFFKVLTTIPTKRNCCQPDNNEFTRGICS